VQLKNSSENIIIPQSWILNIDGKKIIKSKEYFVYFNDDGNASREPNFDVEYEKGPIITGEFIYKGYFLCGGSKVSCENFLKGRVIKIPKKLKELQGNSENELAKISKKTQLKSRLVEKKNCMAAKKENANYLMQIVKDKVPIKLCNSRSKFSKIYVFSITREFHNRNSAEFFWNSVEISWF
jgi:hypothetical protein